MPKTITVLRVFVASPSDVSEERALLDTIIAELNRIWSGTLGVMLDVLKWEVNVRPAFASDPQAAINEQIPPDYDVLIAIFWGRIGTPTPRALSGSIEEFDRAYERLMVTGLPEILLYFKDTPIAPSKIDLDQLKGVQDFKQSLTKKGGLYWCFDDLPSFESSLRSHLSAVAQRFAAQAPNAPVTSALSPMPTAEQPVDDDDDYGYLDYIEISESKQAEMTAALALVSEATVRIGEQLAQRAAEMNAKQLATTRSARRSVSQTAEHMHDYAGIVQTQVAIITAARVEAYSALSKALAMRSDFNTSIEGLQSLRSTLARILKEASSAGAAMQGMRDSAQALPRLTKELNKAKRAVVDQLNVLLTEIDSTKLTVSNIVEAIDKMLGSSADPKH